MNDQAGDGFEREVPSNFDPKMAGMVTREEIDQQIATANRYPRIITDFVNVATQLATLNDASAQECIYALPRDGKVIEGPSARFAEIIAYAWKNSRIGARIVDEGPEFVTAQGVFMDLQQNNAITYEVKRRIVDKNGRRFKLDMIGVTSNAASSIALRNAVLKGIPKAIWSQIYQRARHVVMGDFKTLVNRREEAIKAFVAYGIAIEQILAVLAVRGKDDIGLEQLVVLRGILTAIQEGDTTPEQAFAVDRDSRGPINMPTKREPPQEAGSVTTASGENVSTGTGEITPAAGGGAPQQAQQSTPPGGNGSARANEGMVNLVRQKIKAAAMFLGEDKALTESLVAARFGVKTIEEIPASRVNEALEYVQRQAD